MEKWNTAILIFDGVEVLDFAGPFEVFSRTRLRPGVESRQSDDSAPFHVFTIAKTQDAVTATGGLRVLPDHSFLRVHRSIFRHSFQDTPPIDLLLVPGGFGTRPLLEDAETLHWIASTASAARQVTSVCTGALLLAKAGLLEERKATTHWAALDLLESIAPGTTVLRERRFVDDTIISSAGNP